jgi:hypothetical protein
LDIAQIRVPHSYLGLIEPLKDRSRSQYDDQQNPPRFAATVNIGRRLEPWIVTMQGIDES